MKKAESKPPQANFWARWVGWLERNAATAFLLPTVLVVLAFVLFPLVGAFYSSLARLRFSDGALELSFVGLANYHKLLLGSEQGHFLGQPGATAWVLGVLALLALGMGVVMYQRWRAKRSLWVWLGQPLLGGLLLMAFTWLLLSRLFPGTRMGTLQTTLFYVIAGTALQYLLGLGLALLCAERLPGTRFFRVLFILPLAITPIGVAYMFRMLTDIGKGPWCPFGRLWAWGGFPGSTTPGAPGWPS